MSIKKIFQAFSLVLSSLLLASTVASAEEINQETREVSKILYPEQIQQYIVDYKLQPDSSVNITERILYDFGPNQRRGIIRDIPVSYWNSQKNFTFISNVTLNSVTDENGQEYETDITEGNDLSIRIGDPDVYLTGQHWYIINYDAYPGVTTQDGYIEFNYNPVGDGWNVPVLYAKATLDTSAIENTLQAPMTSYVCFTGPLGSQEASCAFEQPTDKNKFTLYTTRALMPYEAFSIGIAIDPSLMTAPTHTTIASEIPEFKIKNIDTTTIYTEGSIALGLLPGDYNITAKAPDYKTLNTTITVPSGPPTTIPLTLELSPYNDLKKIYIPIGLSLLAVLSVFLAWYTKGRDANSGGSIAPRFTIPADLTPAEIGVIIDQKAHAHDLSAILINLATKGFIKISQIEKKKFFGKKTEYFFTKLKENVEALLLPEYEKILFEAIFEKDKKIDSIRDLDDLKGDYGVAMDLKKIKEKLYETVVKKEYFTTNPEKTRKLWFWLGIGVILFGIFIGGFTAAFFRAPLYTLVLPAAGIAMILFSNAMPQLTETGYLIRREILGLKMYLTKAEKLRYAKLQVPKADPKTFEKLLPYAIALGVEKEWAKQFEGILKDAPQWMEGTGSITNFSNSLSNFSRISTSSLAAASVPPSTGGGGGGSWSGGSSFSGGGFSGGGFGGGGGSSW